MNFIPGVRTHCWLIGVCGASEACPRSRSFGYGHPPSDGIYSRLQLDLHFSLCLYSQPPVILISAPVSLYIISSLLEIFDVLYHDWTGGVCRVYRKTIRKDG